MQHSIGDDPGRCKHDNEFTWLNDLIIDLKLQLLGRAPHTPITMERLDEGTRHCSSLLNCRLYDEVK